MYTFSMLSTGLLLAGALITQTEPSGQSSGQAPTRTEAPKKEIWPDAKQLESMAARFAGVELRVDISKLSAGDRKALVSLIQASRILNDIFMEQLWSGNKAEYQKLKKDASLLGRARLNYFWINKGPWSDLDEHKSFLPGVPEKKLPGANFYPEDLDQEEFESWVKTLKPEERKQAEGFFTVIRRDNYQKLNIVAYAQAYSTDLQKAAKLFEAAAHATDNPSLRKFLNSRANAFLSNDYYQSDVAWMDLDAPLEVTMGPYETYNDELFGYKAAYEAYINLRDDKESSKLAFFGKHLQQIEDNLPIDAGYRNPKIGAAAPIRVGNEIFSAGDGNHGVQAAAYNLPNDERVIQQKGSKRVMLKNIQQAKFEKILRPIAHLVLPGNAQKDLDFDSFFTHIVAHELTHGLGPHQITINGRQTTVRQELKELYSAIEEAKADVTGLFALQHLMQSGSAGDNLPSGEVAERKLYSTFLASSFRTLRFGIKEAHAKGMALEFNYLMDKRGFVPNADGTFSVDFSKVKPAVRDLDHDLLTLEASGDYAGAKKMLAELGTIRPEVRRALDRMTKVPTDINPQFVTANEIAP